MATATASEKFVPKKKGWYSAVVLYEDRVTRDRMIRVQDHVQRGLGEEIDCQVAWWRFDHLKEPRLFTKAVKSAVEADMILFSAHAGGHFPRQVTAWINAWVKQRRLRPGVLGALIGLHDDALSGITPRHCYLRRVAERAQMDFLSQAAALLPDEEPCSVDSFMKRAASSSQLLEGILGQPHFRSFELP